jgi:hypothetical protein
LGYQMGHRSKPRHPNSSPADEDQARCQNGMDSTNTVFDRWVDLRCHVRAQFCEPEWDVAGTYVDKRVNVTSSQVSKTRYRH